MRSGLRITGGKFKGLVIDVPKGKNVRPTTERFRKSIFDILNVEWKDVVAFDLFAGSGIMGLEMLSRGAGYVYFVEKNPDQIKTIRRNIQLVDVSASSHICYGNVISILKSFLKYKKVDIIYIDPPYETGLADLTLKIVSQNILWRNAMVLVEHFHKDNSINEKYNFLKCIRKKRCGDSVVSFFGISEE